MNEHSNIKDSAMMRSSIPKRYFVLTQSSLDLSIFEQKQWLKDHPGDEYVKEFINQLELTQKWLIDELWEKVNE